MKKLFLSILLINTIALTGCFNNNSSTQTDKNTQIETTDEENSNISITAKNAIILYDQYESQTEDFEQDNQDYKNKILNFLNNLDEDNLIPLSNGDEIKIDFTKNVPTTIKITKTYADKNDECTTEDENAQIDKEGYLKIVTDFKNTNIKGCLYEVVAQYDNTFVSYVFGIKSNDFVALDGNVTGYLSSENQQVYDKYKNNTDVNLLKNLEPIVIAQFFAQSLLEGDYDLAYTFFAQTDNLPTQYDFTKGLKNLYKPTKDEYIKNLKYVQNGTFVKESEDKGYVQYEVLQDHPMALDFVKNDDVWKVIYTPIE